MGTLITPGHGAHDIRRNRSQLVPVEFKDGPSYVKHTTVILFCESTVIKCGLKLKYGIGLWN